MDPSKATNAGGDGDGGDDSGLSNDVSRMSEFPGITGEEEEGGGGAEGAREPDDIDRVFDELFPEFREDESREDGGDGEDDEEDDDGEGGGDDEPDSSAVDLGNGIQAQVKDGNYVLSPAQLTKLIASAVGKPAPGTDAATEGNAGGQTAAAPNEPDYDEIGRLADEALSEGKYADFAKHMKALIGGGTEASDGASLRKQIREEVMQDLMNDAGFRAARQDSLQRQALTEVAGRFEELGLEVPGEDVVALTYQHSNREMAKWLKANPNADTPAKHAELRKILNRNVVKASHQELKPIRKPNSGGGRRPNTKKRAAPSNVGPRSAASRKHTESEGSGSTRGSAVSRKADPNSPSTYEM